MTTAITVRRAKPDDVETLAQLLAAAFLDSALGPWLIGDREIRADVYPPYFEIFTEHTLGNGVVEFIGDIAAAFWLPVTQESPPPEIENYGPRLTAAVGAYLPRFQALDAAMDEHHYPHGHDYLAFLAVHPEHQRQGLGSALLRHHHQLLDHLGLPAYLEATDWDTARLYQRHGYQLRPCFAPALDSPPLYPMLRLPTATRTPG